MKLSGRLVKRLKQVKSPIAKAILDLENRHEAFINDRGYLDISYEDFSKISYIVENRLHKFETICSSHFKENKGLKKGDYTYCVYLPTRGSKHIIKKHKIKRHLGHFIIIETNKNEEKTIYVYARYRKNVQIKRDCFHRYSRINNATQVKPGRLIKTIFPNQYSDKEIEEFVTQFYATYSVIKDHELEFKIVEGEDIRRYYHEDKHVRQSGSLGESCMRYDNCQKFFNIYVKNPNQVKMVILVDNVERIYGRALLWKGLQTEDFNPITFMDRIYVTNEIYINEFKQFAKSNNWYHKNKETYENYGFIDPQGKKHTICVGHIILDNADFDYYPYTDTMCYLDKHNRTLYLDETDYTRLNAYETGDPFVETNWSEWEDEYIPEDESIYSDYMDDYIYKQNAVELENNRGWIHIEHDDYIEIDGCCYLTKDVVWSEWEGRDLPKDETVYSEYLSDYLSDYIETYCGEYMPLDHDDVIKHDGIYYFDHDCVESKFHGGFIPEHLAEYHEESDDYILTDELEDYIEQLELEME